MKKNGFILIDIVFGIVLTGMISVALFTSLYQMMRIRQAMIETTRNDNRFLLFQMQVSKDIQGLCIPQQAIKSPARITPKKNSTPSALPQKKINVFPLFFAAQKNDKLEQLSFITTHALQTYIPAAPSHPVTPFLVRVFYTLEKEDGPFDSYRLMRREDTDLSFPDSAKNPAQSANYELIGGIKECSCEYLWYDDSAPPEAGKKILKKITEWDKKNQKQDALAKKPSRAFPDRIDMTVILWNESYTTEKTAQFSFAPLSDPFYTEEPYSDIRANNSQQQKGLP